MALIDEVLVALRTTSADTGLTTEAQTLIDAAKKDLESSGILEDKITEDDALIRQCIIFYVKVFMDMIIQMLPPFRMRTSI